MGESVLDSFGFEWDLIVDSNGPLGVVTLGEFDWVRSCSLEGSGLL